MADTVATEALLVRHVTAVVELFSVVTVATIVRVPPTPTVAAVGDTLTAAAYRTVNSDVARLVVSAAAIAVMIAVPTVTPFTSPNDDTAATAALLVRQITACEAPGSAVKVTPSWRVSPVKIVATAGVISRSRTTGSIVTAAVPRRVVSATETAVMSVLPTETPVTTPVEETVATALF